MCIRDSGGDGEAVTLLVESDFRGCLHLVGGELCLAEDQRQRHREAAGVRRADQLLGIGAGLAFEACGKAVGVFLECSALGRNCSLSVLDPAAPDCGSMRLHLLRSLRCCEIVLNLDLNTADKQETTTTKVAAALIAPPQLKIASRNSEGVLSLSGIESINVLSAKCRAPKKCINHD